MSSAQKRLPETMISPETGETLYRDVRPVIITYMDESLTVDLPGYYPEHGDEGIHVGDDMGPADEALRLLKQKAAERTDAPIR